MKILNILTLLLLSIGVSQAETTDLLEYDIEILIFEDAHARYIGSELWPQAEGHDEDPLPAVEVNEEAKGIDDISGLDKLSLKQIENIDKLEKESLDITSFNDIEPTILLKEHDKIKRSSEYNILYYASWRQYGLEESKAFDIDIKELANAHQIQDQKEPESYIDGKLKIVLARYLHFYTDLSYQRKSDVPLEDASNTALENDSIENGSIENKAIPEITYQAFPVKTHRRMRSKELHYIDHPLVGILVQINPTTRDEAE